MYQVCTFNLPLPIIQFTPYVEQKETGTDVPKITNI